jgi:hypothetical protein
LLLLLLLLLLLSAACCLLLLLLLLLLPAAAVCRLLLVAACCSPVPCMQGHESSGCWLRSQLPSSLGAAEVRPGVGQRSCTARGKLRRHSCNRPL